MTDGSPIGLKYLEKMLENNLPPTIIIISRTKKLSEMAVRTVKERTKNKFEWKSIDLLLQNNNIPIFYTDSHNSDFTHALLKKYKIDIAILGGTGIIKEKTIAIPKIGVINTHPGILPKYRGCSAVEWSLYNNDEVGATCHFVTPKIDAGDIIILVKAKIDSGDDYATVRFKAYDLQAEILIAGLKIFKRFDYKKFLKPNVGGSYYSPIGKKELLAVKKMLAAKKYKHYENHAN
mgnify:CR=1 FL=1